MPHQPELFTEACVLCGSESTPTRRELVEWREPVRSDATGKLEVWSHVPRCLDRVACRSRVELELGEPWPIDDATPAPVRPVPAPDPAPEEESPWLVR
jgi:hypothetical protein